MRYEECWGFESVFVFLFRWNLVVEEFLNVVDGKKMFMVYGNDNSVLNLGDEDFWFVFDFYVGGG